MTIHIENVTKRYGEKVAVDSLSLDVRPGEVFGFLGRNGAGKTTTLRMIVGLLRPTSGRVLIDGFDVQKESKQAKTALGFVQDEPHLYEGLTGREFLAFIGELYGVPVGKREEQADQLIERFEIGDHIDQTIGGYSHGTKQKVALAAALLHNPSNLLLDEPTVGLDPHAAYTLKETLRESANAGVTIMLSTHILEIAQTLCDRFGIIDNGKLLAVGTLDDLRMSIGNPNESLESMFLRLTTRSLAESVA